MFFHTPLGQYLFSYKLACLRNSEQPKLKCNHDVQDLTNIRLHHNSDPANKQDTCAITGAVVAKQKQLVSLVIHQENID